VDVNRFIPIGRIEEEPVRPFSMDSRHRLSVTPSEAVPSICWVHRGRMPVRSADDALPASRRAREGQTKSHRDRARAHGVIWAIAREVPPTLR
jgi:hypothetical protein